jgi:hypothetical protein
MKRKTLHNRGVKLFFSVFVPLLTFSVSVRAQLTKNYATTAVSHSTGAAFSGTFNVPDFAKASDGTDTTYATLNAQTVLLAFNNSSFVEVGFPGNVPEGATVYVPVQDDTAQGLLSTLAGGTLGNLVTGLLGDQFLQVTVKTAAGTTVVSYSSQGNGTRNFTQGRFNFVKGADGQQYITFRANPGIVYSRIRVSAATSGLVAANYQLRVQDAFYLSGAYDACNPFLTTSYDATGITLGLLNGSGLPVKNAQRAIDTDTATFSTFGYGLATVGIGSVFSQDIHFSNLSKPGDQVKIKLRFPSSLLSANVLNTISISAYRHDTLLSTSSLSSLLNAQLLALLTINLNSNIPGTIQVAVDTTAAQTQQFDRIRISYTQLANGSLNEFMEVYSVDRVPAAPVVPVPAASSCPGTALRLAINNVKAGVSYRWYNNAGSVVSTDTFCNVTVPANGIVSNYYVTSSNCAGKESVGTLAAVTGTNANCVSFSPVAFLQGAFDGTRNRDVTPSWAAVLAANATVQPYSAPAFGYTGTETVLPAVFTSTAGNTDIVDWMLLELIDAAGTVVDRKAVFVLENGNVTNLDKSQPVMMKANAGSYYLTIRHRNHLGLSSNLNPYGGGENLFNFTTASDATLFGDANAYTTLNGRTVMRAGNANSNFNTRFNGTANDRDAILFFLGGNESATLFNVYTPVDVNMDGIVRFNGAANDRDALLFNLGGIEYNTIFEQKK